MWTIHDSLLKDVAHERIRGGCLDDLAKIVNGRLTGKLGDELLKERFEAHNCPECTVLTVLNVNAL